jgi:hypothetical protein
LIDSFNAWPMACPLARKKLMAMMGQARLQTA